MTVPFAFSEGARARKAKRAQDLRFRAQDSLLLARTSQARKDQMIARFLELGRGWYSRKWGTTPAGFAFKEEAAAIAFSAHLSPAAAGLHENDIYADFIESSPAQAADRSPGKSPLLGVGYSTASTDRAAKFRELADKMQRDIDAKNAPRQANTPKRQREAQVARHEAARLERTQQALRALAVLYDAGTVPAELEFIRSKAHLYDLCRSRIDTSHAGYYDAGCDTGEPAIDIPATRAIWALLKGPSAVDTLAADLRDRIEKLQFSNIPGYFPTPTAIVARMIEIAQLPDTPCSILEPSAGSGAILDMVRAAAPAADLVIFERQNSLAEILRLKGYTLTGSDFLACEQTRVDRVLMNPPFEKYQDIVHIQRAFTMLKPGGRLVAICAGGPRQREQLEPMCDEWHDLPVGTFKEAGTGVSTALIVMTA